MLKTKLEVRLPVLANVVETRFSPGSSLPDCITSCHSADKPPIHTT
jgi:hypothetical protein